MTHSTLKLQCSISLTSLLLVLMLTPAAIAKPRSPLPPNKPAAPASVPQSTDSACYYRSSNGQVLDLSRLCGQKTTVQVRTPDRVRICYGADGEYFPCPEDLR